MTVAVAAGAGAADHLAPAPAGADAAAEVIRHRGLAVSWAGTPWVDVSDDGEVLVVVDGRLHDPAPGAEGAAASLRRRYRRTGRDVASGVLGDFVVVVLDRRLDLLLVGRDPVGVRPWYQAAAGPRHFGATDVATLAAVPGVDTGVDEATLIAYLAGSTESRGPTFHRGIRTLAPGTTWWHVAGRAGTSTHHRWRIAPGTGVSWDEAVARCRLLLDEAVRCRLDGGGPPTAELSGGLDSSAVVGTMALMGYEGLAAARLLFDGPTADERSYSDAVADHWGIDLVSADPWIPSEEEAWQLTTRLRRPVPDPNFTMFVGLHRTLLGAGRPDGLTGLGGDDAFVAVRVAPRVVSAFQLRQRDILTQIAGAVLRRPREAWTAIVKPTLHDLTRRPRRLPGWVTPEAARAADLADRLAERPEAVTGVAAVDQRLANLTSGYDAAILEMRAVVNDLGGRRESHPFLDPRFIEATYGLDPWWPTVGDHTRALEVAAYRDRLPAAVADRRTKADFAEVFWPQLLDDRTLESIRSGPLASNGWLNAEGFEHLVANARKGMATSAIPLSRCATTDRWLRSL